MAHRPSIRQLEYVVAIADTLHFGRAAVQCAVSQPALSAQVQTLEDQLGVQLFERSRRRVLVTPTGERFVAQARRLLAEADVLVEIATAAGSPLVGPLRLGVIPTVAPYFLPHWLPTVRAAFGELQLELREDRTPDLVVALDEGRLDVILCALPVEGPNFETFALLSEPFVIALPATHPLATGRRKRIPQAALADATVLLLEDGHCLRDQALDLCGLDAADERVELRATSLNTLVQMVANGLGITVLPQAAVSVEVRYDEVAIREFAERPPPTRTVGLAWRSGSARAPGYRELGALLAKHPLR